MPDNDSDQAGPSTLSEILDQLVEGTEDNDETTIQDVLDAFEGRTFGPLLLIPALIAAIPILGAIPLVPTLMALTIILIAAQRLFGKQSPWLPSFVANRSVSHEKLEHAVDKARPWAKRIDKALKPRWKPMVADPMPRILTVIIILLACFMPPLELIPFAAIIPAASIALIALALTVRDGLVTLIGLIVGSSALAIALYTWIW